MVFVARKVIVPRNEFTNGDIPLPTETIPIVKVCLPTSENPSN